MLNSKAWADLQQDARCLWPLVLSLAAAGPAGAESTGEARVFAKFQADHSRVLSEGRAGNGTAGRLLLTAGIEVGSVALFGRPGGRLHVSAMHQTGDDGTQRVNDFQGLSNIDADGFTALTEVWYEHRLLDDRVRAKVGKLDANSEFAAVAHGGGFIHSSPGFSPTILGFPSYPDPATSVNLFYRARSGAYTGFGVYDGATQTGVTTGTRGPSTFLGSPGGLFTVVESGLRHQIVGYAGRVGIGAWHHSGDFDHADGGRQAGTEGFYLVLDQSLATGASGETQLGLFTQYGYADADISPVEHHASAGLQWYGPWPGRPADRAGVMASYVHFSDVAGAGFTDSGELAMEYFYRWQATDRLALQPDLQFIDNAGGRGRSDAWVGTLRISVALP